MVVAAMGVAVSMMMVVIVAIVLMVMVIVGAAAFPIALAMMMGVVIMGGVFGVGMKLGGHGRPRNCEAGHPHITHATR